jgi:hypothetical protein
VIAVTKSIGDLGTARDPVDLTFGYFGLVIRVHPEASDLELVDFMLAAGSIDEGDEVKGSQALGRYLKGLVHPDDWDTFWAAAKGNRQTLTDLMQTAHAVIEAVSGFPTTQPSGSSTGRRSTGRRSRGGSSSVERGQRETRRAMQLLQGRPDLQLVVAEAAEARAARAG